MQQQTTQNEQESCQTSLALPHTSTHSAVPFAAPYVTAHPRSVINRLRHKARRRHQMWKYTCILYGGIGLVLSLSDHFEFSAWYIGLIVALTVGYCLCMLVTRFHEGQARAVLEAVQDVHLIGQLAQALDAEKIIKQPHLIAALRRLLPKLQASDAHLLNQEQRASLYRLLTQRRSNRVRYDRGLILAILKALEQIGDKDALPTVQRVAKWSSDRDIRDAANDCLPFLLKRAEEYKRGQHLLRPADARTSAPEVLLRPSHSTTEPQTPPDQLLRPQEASSGDLE